MKAYSIITLFLVLTINTGYFTLSMYAMITTFGWGVFALMTFVLVCSWVALQALMRTPFEPDCADRDPAEG